MNLKLIESMCKIYLKKKKKHHHHIALASSQAKIKTRIFHFKL